MLHLSNAPLSDGKVRISKIILESLPKSSFYVFFFFYFYYYYYFKSNSYILHCLSDKKSEDFKNDSRIFVKIEFLCFLLIRIEFLCIILFK